MTALNEGLCSLSDHITENPIPGSYLKHTTYLRGYRVKSQIKRVKLWSHALSVMEAIRAFTSIEIGVRQIPGQYEPVAAHIRGQLAH